MRTLILLKPVHPSLTATQDQCKIMNLMFPTLSLSLEPWHPPCTPPHCTPQPTHLTGLSSPHSSRLAPTLENAGGGTSGHGTGMTALRLHVPQPVAQPHHMWLTMYSVVRFSRNSALPRRRLHTSLAC